MIAYEIGLIGTQGIVGTKKSVKNIQLICIQFSDEKNEGGEKTRIGERKKCLKTCIVIWIIFQEYQDRCPQNVHFEYYSRLVGCSVLGCRSLKLT